MPGPAWLVPLQAGLGLGCCECGLCLQSEQSAGAFSVVSWLMTPTTCQGSQC